MALCHSQVTLMLCTDINTTKPHIPATFNMYLVINKWVSAVKVSNFSGHYLRKSSTLDIGVLGYIGIGWPQEHSPEVSHIIPGTPCIYTGCNRSNVRDFGRVFLRSNYTYIIQNTYTQSWTFTEIMAGEIWKFDSRYSLIDYQIHIESGRNMWFL